MAGVGVAADVQALYQDMHSYLRGGPFLTEQPLHLKGLFLLKLI